jgi:hypothetical protein
VGYNVESSIRCETEEVGSICSRAAGDRREDWGREVQVNSSGGVFIATTAIDRKVSQAQNAWFLSFKFPNQCSGIVLRGRECDRVLNIAAERATYSCSRIEIKF